MVEQLTGAATVLVIFLSWVLIVECLTAAAVLLARFIGLQVWAMVGRNDQGQASLATDLRGEADTEPSSHPRYRVGGSLRW